MTSADTRRRLPAVGTLLDLAALAELRDAHPGAELTLAARAAVDLVRQGTIPFPSADDQWRPLVAEQLERIQRPSLRRVVNATGVILHTNLGRAPLAAAALTAIVDAARGASNLEYELEHGARGSRYSHATALLRELTGADDALVVNNCAAALVLALNTLATGRESVISRGELIEIGGSFRVPDIMERSGTTLREVGTTNRTHPSDYAQAIGPHTGAIVKVHRSNFEQRGFVSEAGVPELVALARPSNVPVIHDFGSGLMLDLSPWGLPGEPTVRHAVADGATLVVMSGDKLLGGPQAGIMLGRSDVIARCRSNPLTRALRVDKLTLAALEATLRLYRTPSLAIARIPVLRMLTAAPDELRARADALLRTLEPLGLQLRVIESEATVGGGAFPSARIPSIALALSGDAEKNEARLRLGRLPVIGRIADGALLLDLRSVPPEDDADLTLAVADALGPRP